MPEPKTPPRRRRRPRRLAKPGEVPGTLHVDPNAPKPAIRVFAYGPEDFVEESEVRAADLPAYLREWPVTWVDVVGLGDPEVLQEVARIFALHRLALEDIGNVRQRPKVEQYGEQQFVVMRMASVADLPETEQLSLCLGKNFVVTFQEKPGDSFDLVRDRIRHGKGRIRTSGPDFLTYALLDALIDGYFPLMEHFGDRIESLETEVLDDPTNETIGRVHQTKRQLVSLRRIIWPARETLNLLCRDTSSFSDETRIYLRDCYDHTIQIMELVEAYRESSSDLTNLYLSVVSNRMNEVMKVLTVIATIFIPLTFIAGIYGMNFDAEKSPLNMPELKWYLGYPLCLGVMAVVALGLVYYFYRKGWLSSSSHRATGASERSRPPNGPGNHGGASDS